MTNLDQAFKNPSQSQGFVTGKNDSAASSPWTIKILVQKLLGGLLLVLGFLLSPLSWWNDLLFNLPIAYGFGYMCNLAAPGVLVPAAIAGYWISNVLGIVLMQVGAVKMFQKQPQPVSLRKELVTGLVSSTAYTVLIVVLIQLKVLDGLPLPFDFSLGI
jgi:hypothetical protein